MLQKDSGQLPGPPRLAPEQLIFVTLQDMAGLLEELLTEQKKQRAHIPLWSLTLAVTDLPQLIPLPEGSYSIAVRNDGASNVYFLPRDRALTGTEAPLKPNEDIPLPLGGFEDRRIYIVCATSGTASVRVWAL